MAADDEGDEGASAAVTAAMPGAAAEPVEEGKLLAELEHRLFGRPKEDLQLSRYVVIDRIASGGFGSVYSAYDPELDRRVAIKVLHGGARSGLDDTEARSRLLREAQAMARFSHPNVVSVHDVGTLDPSTLDAKSDEGRDGVFVVMELLEGPTLRAWLAETRRSWREVLDVFVAAGRGLAAAHAEGLVHRDFKPSNVVLATDGRPRVLDFGLARAMTGEAPDSARFEPRSAGSSPSEATASTRLEGSLTRTGAVMGTPTYMAPEQHAGQIAEAPADQYAFCVALYEGLYGARAFPQQSLDELSEAKTREQVAAAPADSGVPAWVHATLLTGLAADPARRHPTMGALLEALTNDPAVRRRRYAWRGIGVALLAALGFTGHQWWTARSHACEGQAAALEGVWDEQTRGRMQASFDATGAAYATTAAATAGSALDDYRSRWVAQRTEVCEAAVVREEVSMETMSERVLCLDRQLKQVGGLTRLFVDADTAVVEHAVSSVSALPDPSRCARVGSTDARTDPAATNQILEAESVIARADALLNSGKFEAGLPIAREAVEAARASGHEPAIARAAIVLAHVHRDLGQLDEAAVHVEEALTMAERAKDDETALQAMILGTRISVSAGNYDAAEQLARVAQARLERGQTGEALQAELWLTKGILRLRQGRPADAVGEVSRGLELQTSLSGPDHHRVAGFHNVLGYAYGDAGQYAESQRNFERAIEIWRASLGDEHPNVGIGMNNLGNSLDLQGKYDESLAAYLEAKRIYEHSMSAETPAVAMIRHNIGIALQRRGQRREALANFREGLRVHEHLFGPEHPHVALSLHAVGIVRGELGDHEGALADIERALQIRKAAFGSEHPEVAGTLTSMGSSLVEMGRVDEGIERHKEAIGLHHKLHPDAHPAAAAALTEYGLALVAAGRPREALQHHRAALEMQLKAVEDDNPELAWTRVGLGRCLAVLRESEEAETQLEQAFDVLDPQPARENPALIRLLVPLGEIRIAAGQLTQGRQLLHRAVELAASPEASPSEQAEAASATATLPD